MFAGGMERLGNSIANLPERISQSVFRRVRETHARIYVQREEHRAQVRVRIREQEEAETVRQ